MSLLSLHAGHQTHRPARPLISRTFFPSAVLTLTASPLMTVEVSTSPEPVQSTMSTTLGRPSGQTCDM